MTIVALFIAVGVVWFIGYKVVSTINRAAGEDLDRLSRKADARITKYAIRWAHRRTREEMLRLARERSEAGGGLGARTPPAASGRARVRGWSVVDGEWAERR